MMKIIILISLMLISSGLLANEILHESRTSAGDTVISSERLISNDGKQWLPVCSPVVDMNMPTNCCGKMPSPREHKCILKAPVNGRCPGGFFPIDLLGSGFSCPARGASQEVPAGCGPQ